MRFSLFYNFDVTPEKDVAELYRDVEAQAILADRLGFDAIWLAEHHFKVYGRLPAPLPYLNWIGARTQQIGLGTAVIEAPYYHPIRLAEDAALLDVMSGGRARLGVGSGAKMKPEEFIKFGLPMEEKTARTLEILEILHQGFSRESIRFEGDYYRYQDVELNPRPLQAAHDLVWVAGSRSTVDLAGERGYGLLVPRVGATAAHKDLIRRYREAANGRPSFVSLLRFVYVAETEREAKEQTRQTFTRYAKYDCGVEWDGQTESEEYVDLADKMHFVIGTPEQVRERLVAWQGEYGFDEIMCQLYAAGMRHEDSMRSLELLGTEVMPHLQAPVTV
ncbi:MAG: LLM class flavin-dependent oxidoreductase [Chloroflexi bacterium]|nr:LLM class flavin-dependent oxidoreductase [Chloroflexota bacterium]